jgi:hypothetical protein
MFKIYFRMEISYSSILELISHRHQTESERTPVSYVLQTISLSILRICYLRPISLQGTKLGEANAVPSSQVRASAVLLKVTAGNWKVRCWGGLKWHNGHAKFGKIRSTGSEVEIGRNEKARAETAW